MAKKNPTKNTNTEAKASVYDVMDLLNVQVNLGYVQKKYKISGSTTDIAARKGTETSTGLLMCDILLGGGIFPGGWYTLFGYEGTAKSTLMMVMSVAFYGSGVPMIVYVDAEGCVTDDTLIKVNGTDVLLKNIIESAIPSNTLNEVKNRGIPCYLCLDSIKVDTKDRKNADAHIFYGGKHPITRITLENGKILSGYNHPVRVIVKNAEQWLNIEDLYIGCIVRVNSKDNPYSKVISIETLSEQHVWDLSLQDTQNDTLPHSIITNDIITHNSSSPDYIETIANSIAQGQKVDCQHLFGVKDNKGKYVIQPRIMLTSENSLETFYKSMSTLLKKLPDKIYYEGDWWLLFDNTKENISRFKGQNNTKVGSVFGKVAIKSIDGGTPQALILLDSIPLLVTDSDDSEDGDNSLAVDARGHSKHLKKLRGKLKRKHATVIAINQLRSGIPIGGKPAMDYEPGGNAVKYASDVRIRLTARAVPHASGALEEEDSVQFPKGVDTYRYIAMKGHKNKYGTPYLETWFRLWQSDPKGKGHGFCIVYDTYQYLKVTGQMEGSLGRKMTITMPDLTISGLTWLDFKAIILFENDKKKLKEICKDLKIEKNPRLRERCFKQMKSGKGMELYFAHMHGLDEEDDIPLEDWDLSDLVSEAASLKLGKKADLKKLDKDKLIEMIYEEWDKLEEGDDDEDE